MAYFITGNLTQVPITTIVTTVTDDPLVLYNTWATELGLSTTATVYNALNNDDVAWPININGYFLEGYQTTLTANASFSSEGAFGFYLNPTIDPSLYVRVSPNLTGVDRMHLLLDRPDVLYTFHPTGLDCETAGVRVQKTANTTIMSGIIRQYDNDALYITFATRFEANKITMVCSAAAATTVDHRLFGLRGTTQTYFQSLELAQSAGTIRKLVFTTLAENYLFSGSINTNEISLIDTWIVTAYNCSTGADIATTTVTGTGYSIIIGGQELCNLTITPKIDYHWTSNKVAVVGDFVISSSPDTTPHLFKVTTGGTFGATEASWKLTGTTTQGTATLTYVAPLIDPITIGPKLGTPFTI